MLRYPVTCFACLACLACSAAACSPNETPPPAHGAYEAGVDPALSCVPNLDGKIEARELVPYLGVPVSFLVSPSGKERPVDLAGVTTSEGKLQWGFGTDYADDQVARIAAQSLDGKWYAPSFSGAASGRAFVVPIDAAGRTEGVYTHGEQGLLLHGVASFSQEGPDKTLLVYTSPVTIYGFPLVNGGTWTTTGEVKNGTLRGLPYAGRDTYEVKVDGVGQLVLPDLTVTQAMRVRTKVTIEPVAGQATTQRQTSFVFECLGEVVRATSKPNEPEENFTTAVDLRRLGLSP